MKNLLLALVIIGFTQVVLSKDIVVLTVATDPTDGFQRFMRSAKIYDYPVKVLGMGQKWNSGDMRIHPGGGQKIMLLKQAMNEYKDQKNLLILFVDSYDVVFTKPIEDVVSMFKKFGARVLFSAEDFCWPDRTLVNRYPPVKDNEKRFLNSGGFIGYADEIYNIVNYAPVDEEDDDQLYYSMMYLDQRLRKRFSMKLDSKAEIFQNLNGALDEVTLKFKGSHGFLYNKRTGTTPIIVHGNGPVYVEFNRICNYLANTWTPTHDCIICKEDKIDLSNLKEKDFPTVQLTIFIESPTAFIDLFLKRLANMTYPKSKIDVFLHCATDFHKKQITDFTEQYKSLYKSYKLITVKDKVKEETARNKAIDECIARQCQYMFVVESEAQITNPMTLQLLIQQNRSIIAPLVSRHGRLWSSFWGGLNKEGFYQRSVDYKDILENKIRGVWNVPHIGMSYLIHGYRLKEIRDFYSFPNRDPDLAFTTNLRTKGIFMYVTNVDYYGHLVNTEEYDTTRHRPDLYQIFDNRIDWEIKYLHEDFQKSLQKDFIPEEPCNDVFWFPIVSPQYCWDLIDEMENLGEWSGGKNADPRIASGYENVPTVDTHMNQIGHERHWLQFLRDYVQPLQQKVYTGYYHNPPHAVMNFVVRYKPTEQPFLRPHHDTSTYTLNMALNRVNVDYQGGGARFIRQNCTVSGTRQGWGLLHPGRLTHYHEGLHTTNGTRYIMVSFIDP